MTKLIFIDTETTGLDPEKHSIVQCAGIVVIDGEETFRFNLPICPRQGTHADPEALKIIGKTREDLIEYPSPVLQYEELMEIFSVHVNKFKREDKYFFVGYNAHFDMQFMRRWWEAMDDSFFGSWFYFPPLDVMTLAANRLMAVRHEMENFKLPTVCKQLDIEWSDDDAHDALYDVEKTVQLYNNLFILD